MEWPGDSAVAAVVALAVLVAEEVEAGGGENEGSSGDIKWKRGLDELVTWLRATFGQRLNSVVLYGSAAAGEHVPKKSDYNILVLLDRIPGHGHAGGCVGGGTRMSTRATTAMTMTTGEWKGSADVFPMEYADVLGGIAYRTTATFAGERGPEGPRAATARGREPWWLSQLRGALLPAPMVRSSNLWTPTRNTAIAGVFRCAALLGQKQRRAHRSSRGWRRWRGYRATHSYAWRATGVARNAFARTMRARCARAVSHGRGAVQRLHQPSPSRPTAAIAGLPAAAFTLAGCGYLAIQKLDEQANGAQGQIEVQLQRRADLVPNLVATEGHGPAGLDMFTQIAERTRRPVEHGRTAEIRADDQRERDDDTRTQRKYHRFRTHRIKTARVSCGCRMNWRAQRTGLRLRTVATARCGSTTRTSRQFPAVLTANDGRRSGSVFRVTNSAGRERPAGFNKTAPPPPPPPAK